MIIRNYIFLLLYGFFGYPLYSEAFPLPGYDVEFTTKLNQTKLKKGPYNLRYETPDGALVEEGSRGNVRFGHYSYVAPEGHVVMVYWTSGVSGYRASVRIVGPSQPTQPTPSASSTPVALTKTAVTMDDDLDNKAGVFPRGR